MELRRYVAITRRWLWLLVLALIMGIALAFTISRLQTRIYVARSTILVNQAQQVTGPTYSDVLANQQLTKTYSELVTSDPVLERVAQDLDIPYDTLRDMVS